MSRIAGDVSYDHWCDTCGCFFHSTSGNAQFAMRSHKARSADHRSRERLVFGSRRCQSLSDRRRSGGYDDDDNDDDNDDDSGGDKDDDYVSLGDPPDDDMLYEDVDFAIDVDKDDIASDNDEDGDDGMIAEGCGTIDEDAEGGTHPANTASMDVWRMQEQMKMEFEEGGFRTRKPRGNKSYEVALRLGGFINRADLSESTGAELLAIVQEVVDHHVDDIRRTVDIPISTVPKMELYKTVAGIDALVGNDPHGYFTTEKKVAKLSPWFFGEAASDARPMIWEKVKILPLIGYALLTINNVANFKSAFEERRNHRGERVYGPFSSGNVCRDVNRQLVDQFGPGFSGLFLSCSYDSAQTTKRAGGSKCPLLFSMYNCESGAWEYYFVGYIPDELPYTAVEANKILIDQGWSSKADRKYILAKELRQQIQKFAVWAFEDLMKFQETGLILQVGMGLPGQGEPKIVKVVPAMIGCVMDTAANSGASQVAFNGKRSPCRCCDMPYDLCTQGFPVRINHAPRARDSAEDERLSLECSYEMNDHLGSVRSAAQERLPVPRKTEKLKLLLQAAHARGHDINSHGRNFWYDWFRLTMGCALLIGALGFRAKWSMHDSFLIA